MLITRTSIISGCSHVMNIPVTEEQLDDWVTNGIPIQDAMPELTDDQREFIMTGITPDEWQMLCNLTED